MSRARRVKGSRPAIVLLAITAALGCAAVACSGPAADDVAAADPDPFVFDRVVEVRIVLPEEDWTAMQANPVEERYFRADFWFDGEPVSDVAVRPKGNSSLRSVAGLGSPRLSLKVDFNLFNSARTFRGLKKLNFNNGFKDPTLIRERLASELFAWMDVPAPRVSHVDLWVNDTHLGVYSQVEQIDKTFLGKHFARDGGNLYKPEEMPGSLNWTEAELEEQRAVLAAIEESGSADGLDLNVGGGKLREIMDALEQKEPATPAAEEKAASGEPMPPMPPEGPRPQAMPPEGWRPQGGAPPGGMPPPEGFFPPEGFVPPEGFAPPEMMPGGMGPEGWRPDYMDLMGLKTNENSPDHSALFELLDVLNSVPDDAFPSRIEKVLDVDGALRFLAVSTMLVHLDNYIGSGHNYYLYEIDGRFTVLPWDFNEAFGTFNMGIDREGLINYYIDEPTCGPVSERPLAERLLSHPPYLDRYHEYLDDLLNGPFAHDALASRVDELADLIRPFVEADELKFFSTADFERGLTEDIEGFGAMGNVPVPGVGPVLPALSRQGMACLEEILGVAGLEELVGRMPSPQEIEKLASCLPREDLVALQQLRAGGQGMPRPSQGEQVQPPGGGPEQPRVIGLKAFAVERGASVRQQLDGDRPSAGDGRGNSRNQGVFEKQDRQPEKRPASR